MNKGEPLGSCKTCNSEIVSSVNDGVFRGGECDACEYHRYNTQPELLQTVKSCVVAFGERLSCLNDELKEDFADEDDINDQIGNYEYLVDMCNRAIANGSSMFYPLYKRKSHAKRHAS